MLNKKAILMTLSLSSFTPRKTDKRVTSQVLNQHAAASDAGKFVKNLLPDDAIEPIKKLDGEIRQFHYDNTVLNGTQVKIEAVEELAASLRYRELFGQYRLIRIEEVD